MTDDDERRIRLRIVEALLGSPSAWSGTRADGSEAHVIDLCETFTNYVTTGANEMSKDAKQNRPQTKRQQDEHAQVEQDMADATTREGMRQAAIEHQTALDAADDARQIAAQQADAQMAKATFWERFKASLGL